MIRQLREFVGGWVAWGRAQAAPLGVGVRVAHLLAVGAAGWLVWTLAPGDPATFAFVVVGALGIATVAWPEEVFPALELVVLVVWWAVAGVGAGRPWWIGFAVLLGVVHVSAAAAASWPLHAGVTGRGARAVALRIGGFVVGTALASGLVVAVGLADALPRGWWWVALVALGIFVGAVCVARRTPAP